MALLDDILESLYRSGFRRIVIVNGHGGNGPILGFFKEWMARRRDARVKFHEWWKAPRTWAKVQEIDPAASHASWMENFPWTRLPGVKVPGDRRSRWSTWRACSTANPAEVRKIIGDGNYHGLYERPDAEMLALWQVAVEETRAIVEKDWP